jgi:hypothetical protein
LIVAWGLSVCLTAECWLRQFMSLYLRIVFTGWFNSLGSMCQRYLLDCDVWNVNSD